MKTELERFEDFLAGIDLEHYRNQYRRIKIVELDMPRNVQALATMYEEYWHRRENRPDYPAFYETYASNLAEDLEAWRMDAQFSKETFYRGLPARIYRTWASLLTQIQGAYVAETIYGRGNVSMSVSEDRRGKDLVIDLGAPGRLPVQIKKRSERPEAQRGPGRGSQQRYIQVGYAVPAAAPMTKAGKPSKRYADWEARWGDRIKRLDNGFVVFRPPMFELQNLLQGIVE